MREASLLSAPRTEDLGVRVCILGSRGWGSGFMASHLSGRFSLGGVGIWRWGQGVGCPLPSCAPSSGTLQQRGRWGCGAHMVKVTEFGVHTVKVNVTRPCGRGRCSTN